MKALIILIFSISLASAAAGILTGIPILAFLGLLPPLSITTVYAMRWFNEMERK